MEAKGCSINSRLAGSLVARDGDGLQMSRQRNIKIIVDAWKSKQVVSSMLSSRFKSRQNTFRNVREVL